MINFRYHIVSLTAVFLALVIGILMGTTVVSKATVDGLKANLARAEARSAAVHQTNNRLSGQLSTRIETDDRVDAALTEHALANAVDGALEGVPVVVLASDGVDKDVVEQTLEMLDAAGARLDGTLVVQPAMVLADDDADKWRELLDLGADQDVQTAVIRQLAVALAHAALPDVPLEGVPTTTTTATTTATPTTIAPPDTSAPESGTPDDPATEDTAVPPTTTVPAPTQPEIVELLRREGLLEFRPAEGVAADAPILEAPELAEGTGYRYVLLVGDEVDVTATKVLAPLAATLARLGPVPQVVATGPQNLSDPGDDAFLASLLRRDGVKGGLSTVDDVGSYAGYVALGYALAVAGDGQFGSYGIGRTATAVLPSFRPPED